MSERAFREHMNYKMHELANHFAQSVSTAAFQASVSWGPCFQRPADVLAGRPPADGIIRESVNKTLAVSEQNLFGFTV
jgi:hypothetical protein